MFTKCCNTRSSGYSFLYDTKNIVDRMVTLNDLSNSWMREWWWSWLLLIILIFILLNSSLIIAYLLILIIIFILFTLLILIIFLGRRSGFIWRRSILIGFFWSHITNSHCSQCITRSLFIIYIIKIILSHLRAISFIKHRSPCWKHDRHESLNHNQA
jgi:hypothetical protein